MAQNNYQYLSAGWQKKFNEDLKFEYAKIL